MNISRCAAWLTLALALAGFNVSLALAQATDEAGADQDDTVVVSDDTDLTVPEGDAATILAFIEKVANPQQQFTSEEELQTYLDGCSKAIAEASDKVLADDKATDRQVIDAIEWKIEALRIREKLGDADANKKTEDFLANLQFASRPTVEDAIKQIQENRATMQIQMELMSKLRTWPRLDAAERTATTDKLIEAIKSGGVSASKASMLTMFCDNLADSPDSALAENALDELLPLFRESTDPGVAEKLRLLEGISRRLHLPGNKLELAGTLIDGQPLDWDSYRGKVVLVDFWATWCGPCRAEVPNILENYLKYHDKGFEVIGISLDEKRSEAEDYLTQTNIPWPTLFHESSEGSGWENPMAVKYGITGIPTAILVDQEGNVVSMQARGARLGAALQELLGQPAEDASSAVEITDDERTAAQ